MTDWKPAALRHLATRQARLATGMTLSVLLLAACMKAAPPDMPASEPVAAPAPSEPESTSPSGRPDGPVRNGHPLPAPAAPAAAPETEGPSVPSRATSSHAARPAVPAERPQASPAAPAGPARTAPVPAPPPASDAEDYSLQINATRELKIPGPPGKLSVWIGLARNAPAVSSRDVSASRSLRETGRTAKITPIALGMDTDPPTGCLKIDPDGSEKIFSLRPRSRGSFQVGASVELFNSDDCSGTPVPKSSELITVKVKVGYASRVDELAATAWQALLDFWAQALALVSALLLFLLRKQLAGWFGFRQQK